MRLRWPWKRWSKSETQGALRAQKRLDYAKSRDAEVNSLAEQLRQVRDTNHFADLLAATFRDRPR